jgi:cytoskeletal protein RodZ
MSRPKKGAAAEILHDDQSMSIDLVAVYAAVVATGALSWQVYQSLSERKGRLDERKGSLDIDLSTEWRAVLAIRVKASTQSGTSPWLLRKPE